MCMDKIDSLCFPPPHAREHADVAAWGPQKLAKVLGAISGLGAPKIVKIFVVIDVADSRGRRENDMKCFNQS